MPLAATSLISVGVFGRAANDTEQHAFPLGGITPIVAIKIWAKPSICRGGVFFAAAELALKQTHSAASIDALSSSSKMLMGLSLKSSAGTRVA